MRIVTRPDFDGIVCAVLLRRAEQIKSDIYWTEPNEIQSGNADIRNGDILANLPYARQCALWFDHHVSNKPGKSVPGAFKIAPSAARVVYEYYLEKGKLTPKFDELVAHTDIIDAALLDRDQVLFPQKYPFILLSMTIKNDRYQDIDYWNHLVDMLAVKSVRDILKERRVEQKCRRVIEENRVYEEHLKKHTRIENRISITDFRLLDQAPEGNRFLSYCLFPESIASVKLRYSGKNKEHVQISIGASIFNKGLNVNIGRLLADFGGGGHAGAGGCTLESKTAEEKIDQILKVLFENRKK